MRRRIGSAAIGLLLLAVLLTGCGLSGLDREYGQDGGRSPDGSRPLDGSPVLVDAPSDVVNGGPQEGGDACATAEDCSNGVDDDCNGLVDCSDPACQDAGFSCTTADVPAGWSLVAFSAGTRPSCPPSYAMGAEQALVSSPAGEPATCSCACSGGMATCEGTAIYIGYANSCVTGSSVNLPVANGACGKLSESITAGDSYELNFQSSVAVVQGSCTGAGQVTGTPPAPTFQAGAACTVSTSLGGGCTAGVCAPPVGTAFGQCIMHTGQVACPTFGFSQQILVSTGMPGYVDMRGCGACQCSTGLSCGEVGNVALFTNDTCAGGAAFNVNSGCQLINGSGAVASYQVSYSPTGNAACAPSGAPPAPTGSIALDANVQTVCCSP